MKALVSIKELLSTSQQRKLIAIYEGCKRDSTRNLHRELVEQIVLPNMGRINRATEQENNPDYIAYMLEHALNSATT